MTSANVRMAVIADPTMPTGIARLAPASPPQIGPRAVTARTVHLGGIGKSTTPLCVSST